MKPYETNSCGYTLKFNGPETVADYDSKGGDGACLKDACLKTIYQDVLPDWQEAFATILSERTGINRLPEEKRLRPYNIRVIAEWANGNEEKRAQLQAWAQEIADKIELDPSPLPATTTAKAPAAGGKSGDLAKANEILSHDSAYIEERVSLMLSTIPDYNLLRDIEGKPDAQSLARLLNRWIIAQLKL